MSPERDARFNQFVTEAGGFPPLIQFNDNDSEGFETEKIADGVSGLARGGAVDPLGWRAGDAVAHFSGKAAKEKLRSALADTGGGTGRRRRRRGRICGGPTGRRNFFGEVGRFLVHECALNNPGTGSVAGRLNSPVRG